MDAPDDVIRVLVAAADPATRTPVVVALDGARFAVSEATDTQGALLAIATDLPAVVVLDADLPGPGAVAIARTLPGRPETAGSRVLVLTRRGAPRPTSVDGVHATLATPATPFALLRTVEALLDDVPGSPPERW